MYIMERGVCFNSIPIKMGIEKDETLYVTE